jgi:DNA-binding transcriptional LysR family regulator
VDRRGRKIAVQGRVVANDLGLLYRAALAGHGIAYLPHAFVEPALAKGKLVRVLARSLEGETKLAVVYVEREYMPPQVRAFVDMVVAWSREPGVRFKGMYPPQPGE